MSFDAGCFDTAANVGCRSNLRRWPKSERLSLEDSVSPRITRDARRDGRGAPDQDIRNIDNIEIVSASGIVFRPQTLLSSVKGQVR